MKKYFSQFIPHIKEGTSCENWLKEPTSFVDLVINFTKPSEDKSAKYRVITIPLYVVNITSGNMTRFDDACIYESDALLSKENFCLIKPFGIYKKLLNFFVKKQYKLGDKLTHKHLQKTYTPGNFELYLHENDAAIRAKEILATKIKKLKDDIDFVDKIIRWHAIRTKSNQ